MTINSGRLWKRLMELGEIGLHESGGITRFSFTEEERQAKNLVASYMKDAGLAVREDAAGNLIGRLEGMEPSASVILTGSHIDTVPHGGKFDGALGVLAAIEVLQTMKEQGIIAVHPIEVVAFTDEEGSRFGFGMLGSRAIAGTLHPDDLENKDVDGITIAEAMRSIGLYPERLHEAVKTPKQVKGYVELHIEQGKVLEDLDAPAGLVTGIAGPLWQQLTITGQAGHAGATPMNIRKDPLQAAAEVLNFIYTETKKFPNAVATIGQLQLFPGGINVIPGQLQFSLDLRDIDEAARDVLEGRIRHHASQVCRKFSMELQINLLQRVAPAPSSIELKEVIAHAGMLAGLANFPELVSGAGHDGMQFNGKWPIGMIFVRSRDGISHHPEEWSTESDCGFGAQVLYYALLRLAQ